MGSDEIAETLTQQLYEYYQGLVTASPRIAVAVAILLLMWGIVTLVRAVIRKLGHRMHFRTNLIDVLEMIASTGLWMSGLLIALTVVFPTITPGKAITALGLGSVAIGFAFKDTFENFLAGILVLLREPFEIGDYVECEGVEGQVEEITIRDTRIRQTDGQLVVMPNHELFQNPVRVRTDKELRRTSIVCGIAYDEDVDEARAVIEKAVVAVESVRDDLRDVQVFAHAFGSSSVDFEITWWTGSKPIDIRSSRDQVISAIKSALDKAEIEIPFPYRTLTFKDALPVEQQEPEE